MSVTKKRMALVFDEWARQFKENPEEFTDPKDFQYTESYGEDCASSYLRIEAEMDGKGLLPALENTNAP